MTGPATHRPTGARREPSGPLLFAAAFWPFLGATALLLLVGRPAEAGRRLWPRADILAAIRHVESSGREEPPDGDGGLAIGPYQIHYVYWLDARSGDAALGGDYQDCRRRAYAERVIDAYMRRYAPAAWRAGEAETVARIHNGGPRGHRRAATLVYWRKVRERLPQ